MNNRCFNTYNTTKMSGSDYIKAKKRKTLFQASRTIAIGNINSNIPAGYLVKQNNAVYNGPIYINPNTLSIHKSNISKFLNAVVVSNSLMLNFLYFGSFIF